MSVDWIIHGSNEAGHLPCRFGSTCASVASLTNFMLLCNYFILILYVSDEWSSCSLLCKIRCHIMFLKFKICERLCVNDDMGVARIMGWFDLPIST